MREPQELTAVLKQWVRIAEDDLLAAAGTLKLGGKYPAYAVCFHAQECVQKYLKAILVMRRLRVPKTDNLANILAMFPRTCHPPLNAEEQKRHARYTMAILYPSKAPPPSLTDARDAVKVARRVRAWCRKLLPPAALRKEAREAE